MQIVIDIPESIYDTIQSDEMISREQLAVLQMHILNGTPLPKGHGRLIDADDLLGEFRDGTEDYDFAHWTRFDIANIIDNAPTIVEADRGDEE